MAIQKVVFRLSLAMLAVAVLGTGCVTNGRRVLLKEYGPSTPAVAGGVLQGKTVCLKAFNSVSNLVSFQPVEKPDEPASFKYTHFSQEQEKLWDKEMHQVASNTPKEKWILIGNMRNGWGMVMSHVYALNDPSIWLTEGLKYDLEAQGAKVVDASQSGDADVSVSGTLKLCRLDMYFTMNGDLVIDVDVQPRHGLPHHRQIRTKGGTLVTLASEGEYFHALREARQKFSELVIQEVVEAAKQSQ